MKVYLIRHRINNQYKSTHFVKEWTDDIDKARLYKRSCDARQSVYKDPGYAKWDDQYELVPCEVNLSASQNNSVQNVRPDWNEYFLGLALVVSKRSHDIQTQHGCLLVDSKTRHILATGYNGFPRGMNDASLPNTRPDKYPWMLHSEFNACCNLTRPADKNTVAYITGEPCTPCLMCLWQHGVSHVVHRDAYGSNSLIDESTRQRRDILLAQTGMIIEVVKTDLDWLKAACLNL